MAISELRFGLPCRSDPQVEETEASLYLRITEVAVGAILLAVSIVILLGVIPAMSSIVGWSLLPVAIVLVAAGTFVSYVKKREAAVDKAAQIASYRSMIEEDRARIKEAEVQTAELEAAVLQVNATRKSMDAQIARKDIRDRANSTQLEAPETRKLCQYVVSEQEYYTAGCQRVTEQITDHLNSLKKHIECMRARIKGYEQAIRDLEQS